ncbi:MAG: hypothetical protein ABGX22_11050 [Pirellulaceae bacterium]
MRLTLRTLLAYLDEILPEKDAKAIRQKLETSERASGLVHRIRSATRKLRLSAPPIDGRGMGGDANTVAEYLDNTLAADRITDFERVCLESDVQLAEAATCHQIVWLVLTKPAEVAPEVRERIYALGKAESAGGGAAANAPAAATAVKVRAEIPDYLRHRPWNWKAAAMVVALTLLLVVAGLRALGPFTSDHPVIGGLFSEAVSTASNGESDKETNDDETDPILGKTKDNAENGAETIEPAITKPEPNITEPKPTEPTTTEPMPTEPTTTEPMPTEPTTTEPMPTEPTITEPKPTEPKPIEPSATEIGRYLASARPQFLGHQSDETGDWTRLGPRTVLQTGSRLLTLPTYRPQVALTTGVQMTMVGPAEVTVNRNFGTSTLQIKYGRFLLDTAGIAGAKIELEFGSRRGTATFANPEATLAVKVAHRLVPSADPLTGSRTEVISLHTTSGTINWIESKDAAPIVIEAGTVLMFQGSGIGSLESVEQPIAWVDGQNLREIDLRASRELEPLLDTERPIHLALMEQADARQVEVSALAIRSLSVLGFFDQAVSAFNEQRQHSYWRYHVATLVERVAYSPESAREVRAALGRLREQDATVMYRSLCGYTPQQLNDGGAAKLVDMLESDSMDMRVLGLETLRSITGKTHLYRPEKKPIQQKKPLQDWHTNLLNGEIHFPE